MVQLTLHGKPSQISDEEIYGDSSKYKHPDSTRLESNNVGGLNVNHRDSHHIGPADKTTRILNRLKAKKVDIAGIQEPNIDWRNQEPAGSFYQRVKQVLMTSFKAVVAHNTTDTPKLTKNGNKMKQQYGGSIMIALTKLVVSKIIGADKDPEGLGRWVSILLKGKKDYTLRAAAGYVPCKNKTGLSTVYSQQQKHFRVQKTDQEPIQAMMEDFEQAVSSWVDAGEKIVIMMDANSDVRDGELATMLKPLGFKEQITFRHGPNEPPPGTHETNESGRPIDGIWTNFAHGELRCGYEAYEDDDDHRHAWIDIPN